jgi:hypothetical protein
MKNTGFRLRAASRRFRILIPPGFRFAPPWALLICAPLQGAFYHSLRPGLQTADCFFENGASKGIAATSVGRGWGRGGPRFGIEKCDSRCNNVGEIMLFSGRLFPAAGLQRAFDTNQASLSKVLIAYLSSLAIGDNPVPFGRFVSVSRMMVVCCQTEFRHPCAPGCRAFFGISAQSSYQ